MRISDWSSDVCSSDLGIREIIIEKWPLHAAGEIRNFIPQFLADLIEFFLQHGDWHGVAEYDCHVHRAWPGDSFHAFIIAQFLNPLFQAIRHQILHFFGVNAWPCGARSDEHTSE